MSVCKRLIAPLSIATLFLMFAACSDATENAGALPTPVDEQLVRLQEENLVLAVRIKELEAQSCISSEHLRQKKAQKLKDIAVNVKLQRQSMSDFEGFVKWMSTNLAGYSRYIQAGSYAALIGRMLPIPYAGQASIFTKFVAQFTVALNAASVSISNYLNSSRKFIAMSDAIDTAKAPDEKAVAEAALFAERQLLKDMNDAQNRLSTVSDLSSGALSFLESLNHYVSGTDEYWNKAKGILRKDVDPKEKSFISESTSGLKRQADHFNSRLKNFAELASKETTAVKSLAVYDELANEARAGSNKEIP